VGRKKLDWTISEIAKRIKQTRDETFVRTVKVGDKDVTVNRTEGIAWLVARPTTARTATWEPSSAARLGWCTWNTKHGYDTRPRWPVSAPRMAVVQ